MGIEIWKNVNEYENYEISNQGKIRSKASGKILVQRLNNMGYYRVALWNCGKQKHHLVHRLLATHFINNPDNLKVVDHVDLNPKNNDLSNLRFCTTRQNNINKRTYKNNTSGSVGIDYIKRDNVWRARYQSNEGKEISKRFNNKEFAVAWRNEQISKISDYSFKEH